MAEIHAFKPDGTPSPGAQIALDDAVTGIPEATTEAAGLMAASDKAAMGDASALTSGTVPAARLPAATDANAGAVTLAEVSSRAADVTQAALTDVVHVDELFHSVVLVDEMATVITTLFVAPFPMRITSVAMVFDTLTLEASSSKHLAVTLRKFNNGGTVMVQRSSADGGIKPRVPWLFDSGTWDNDASHLDVGDMVNIGFTTTGNSTSLAKFPASITLGYQPE
ncbi:hypothetical protein ACTXMZ_17950 [Brachybacterium alimentarium]|uniref:hypothetical protein n=1 Tax=Brachybacterium alimentarium TaxID=47845 RepID=UPI003FD3B29D